MNDNTQINILLLPPCDVHNLFLIAIPLDILSQRYLQISFADTTSLEYVYSTLLDESQVRVKSPHTLGWVWDIKMTMELE